MQGRVWTAGRKWMGNLIPLAFMLPLAITGVVTMIQDQEITPLAIGFCVGALVVGWIAVDLFGFFGNATLKREIQKKVLPKAGRDASGGTFVGFARPSYSGLLDAHEDLGYLFLTDNSLEYVGEIHQVSIPRKDILAVRYRPNIHSALGLGRWVSVEAMHEKKPVRVLVEPREARTLLGNKRVGTELRKKIDAWRKR
jgi:hypothetical protein